MMDILNFSEMLALVAKAYNSTPEIISSRIAQALAQGQQSPDPQIRALWESLPHTGDELTLSDYVIYLAKTLEQPFDP